MNILEEALAYEYRFEQNFYNGSMSEHLDICVNIGSIPILVSAPHTTNLTRFGVEKLAEPFTGALGCLLHEYTKCHWIHTTRNHDWSGVYKKIAHTLIKDECIKFVLDLHGAKRSHPFDVDLGTNWGASCCPQVIREIQTIFAQHGILDVRENDTFKADNPKTLIYGLPVSGVQFEINNRLRNAEHITELFTAFCAIIEFVDKSDFIMPNKIT